MCVWVVLMRALAYFGVLPVWERVTLDMFLHQNGRLMSERGNLLRQQRPSERWGWDVVDTVSR